MIPALVAVALGLAACGSSSKAAAPTTTTTVPPTTTTTVPPTTTTTTTTSTTTSSSKQTISVTPDTGLTTGESVHIKAAGFTPKETLVVSECKNVANVTESDCNIAGVKMVTADASGTVDTTFTVEKTFSGITCSGKNACLVSVTQESPNPTQAASAPITFK